MGRHQARFDAKGRVSIPAPFRATLRGTVTDGPVALVLRPSHNYACIDALPVPVFDAMQEKVDQLSMFGADQDDLITTLYADAWAMEADKEGRIVLHESLVQHAGLSQSVVFMGLGSWFQLWEPDAAAARIASARQGAVARGLTLPGAARGPAAGPGTGGRA